MNESIDGCAACGKPETVGRYWFGKDHVALCQHHACAVPALEIPGLIAEYRKSLSLRSAPAPESATGEGEFYGTQPDPLPETLPAGTRWGAPMHFITQVDAPLKDGGYLFHNSSGDVLLHPSKIDWTSVRKSPTSSRSVSAETKPTAVGVSDPYKAVIPDTDPRVAGQPLRDIYYRSRVRELRLDMDRPLPRTWKDRMGVLVGFDGPVDSKGKGR